MTLKMTQLHSPLLCCCLALALSACAPTIQRPSQSKSPKPSVAIQSEKKSAPPESLASAETKPPESNPPELSPVKSVSEPLPPSPSSPASAELYLALLGEVHGLTGEQSRRELAELNTAKRLDRAQRFELAALLSRDEHGDWERAMKALDGWADEVDPRTLALIDILRKSLRARLDLRQQTARVAELQQRIEQIKALEKDLQHRSGSTKTP